MAYGNSHQQAVAKSMQQAQAAKHVKGASNRSKVTRMQTPKGFKANC